MGGLTATGAAADLIFARLGVMTLNAGIAAAGQQKAPPKDSTAANDLTSANAIAQNGYLVTGGGFSISRQQSFSAVINAK